MTIASLLREIGADRVDLLKVDIEGAEFDALRDAPIDRVGEIIAEVHYDLGDGDEQTVRDLLPGFRLRLPAAPAARPLPRLRHEVGRQVAQRGLGRRAQRGEVALDALARVRARRCRG